MRSLHAASEASFDGNLTRGDSGHNSVSKGAKVCPDLYSFKTILWSALFELLLQEGTGEWCSTSHQEEE